MKIVFLLLVSLVSTQAFSGVAPDATKPGPFKIDEKEYKLDAQTYEDILPDRLTELWARMYFPVSGGNHEMPLLLFLHGNHATCGTGKDPRKDDRCDYTRTGECPTNYIVVPNHRGYDYIARRLASWGYLVVSINANRGITCGSGVKGDFGLNLARGRLILKHIQFLADTSDLKIDFSQVGLMGHSRGGEGARAAYEIFNRDKEWQKKIKKKVTFRGIFEIAPVDGQTSKVLNANGIAWTVLLPMCDGDVSQLSGIRPFDRMIREKTEKNRTHKSTYVTWGANHNFYSTEWQISDSSGCQDHEPLWTQPQGKERQMHTGLSSIMAFFRANVGKKKEEKFNANFSPLYALPQNVQKATHVERAFFPTADSSVTRIFENFDKPTGTNTHGAPNISEGIQIAHQKTVPRHDSERPAATIQWTSAQESNFLQSNWTGQGEGHSVKEFQTLDFDISRSSSTTPLDPINFSVQLVDSDNRQSNKLSLFKYLTLLGPVGGPAGLHPILQTARFPLAKFNGVNLERIRGVRLVFDQSSAGNVFLTSIRFSKVKTAETNNLLETSFKFKPNIKKGPKKVAQKTHPCKFRTQPSLTEGSTYQEVQVSSPTAFIPRGSLPTLVVGGKRYGSFRRPKNGRTDVLIFRVHKKSLGKGMLESSSKVRVEFGNGRQRERVVCKK